MFWKPYWICNRAKTIARLAFTASRNMSAIQYSIECLQLTIVQIHRQGNAWAPDTGYFLYSFFEGEKR